MAFKRKMPKKDIFFLIGPSNRHLRKWVAKIIMESSPTFPRQPSWKRTYFWLIIQKPAQFPSQMKAVTFTGPMVVNWNFRRLHTHVGERWAGVRHWCTLRRRFGEGSLRDYWSYV
jgi:hypothetical protein